MKKKILKTILILISIIFLLQIKVQAAVVVSTDKQVESGSGNVTISITSKQALGAYKLKVTDTAGLELIDSAGGEISSDKKTITGSSASGITNLGTYTFKIPTVSNDTTYKIKFSITGMETVNLETVNDEINIATITVKAPVATTPETPSTDNNNQTQTPSTGSTGSTTTTKSSEASLTNLGINPNDFKGFKSSKTEYSVEVPNSVASVEIYATAAKNGKVTGTGTVTLKEGDNKFEVKVTSEDGNNTKTYTLTIKRKTADEEAKENGEARLKSLGIKPEEYDFTGFDSEKTEYTAEVPNEVEEIEVYATAMNSSAQITGTGMITLEEGLNELKIEVIAADGTKKTYTLAVTRKESEESAGTTTDAFGLSILTVQGLTLSPKFNTETYEYTIDLKEDISSLEIGTRPTADDATVEIVGNENLQLGENVITILVTDKENKEVVTYQITVNKNVVVEEIAQTSWLKPETWGKEEKIKIAIIIVLIVLIICAIILKIKISKENDNEKKMELPGADELDKAITEHQELSEEPNHENEAEQNYIEEIAKNKFGMEEENIEVKAKRKGRHF